MKKADKEYIEEILNELIFSKKKPSNAQVRRLTNALEKIKNTPSSQSFVNKIIKQLYEWFIKDD